MQFILEELPLLTDRPARWSRDSLTPDTNLFQGGFVDSLGFVQLLAFLEELLDISIPEEKILMRNFRSIRAIWNAFGREALKEKVAHEGQSAAPAAR